MNMLLICLFASMKLEKGHKNNYLALVLKVWYNYDIFHEIRKYYKNGGLNKKLNTIQSVFFWEFPRRHTDCESLKTTINIIQWNKKYCPCITLFFHFSFKNSPSLAFVCCVPSLFT